MSLWDSMEFSVYMLTIKSMDFSGKMFFFFNFPKYVLLLFVVQTKGWYGVVRIEEMKLVCAISRKTIFGWKTLVLA